MRLPLLLLMTASVLTITVPLQDDSPRCLMTFAYGAEDSIKLQLKFPKIADRQEGEYYELKWRNTQTHQTSYDQLREGIYKHEIDVQKNIIYELCIRFVTDRHIGVIKVDYSARNEFYFNNEAVKLPENLLKSKDLENIYLNALDIKNVGDKFIEIQDKRAEIEEYTFESTRNIGWRLLSLCRVELAIIIVTAVYQLVAVRKYLLQKHYV